MSTRSPFSVLPLLPIALGMALHAWTALFEGADDGGRVFRVLLFAWACSPYLACLVAWMRGHRVFAMIAATGCLVVDASVYHDVFVAPTSSTAALGLFFAPAVNWIIVLPIAAGIACLIARLSRRRSAA